MSLFVFNFRIIVQSTIATRSGRTYGVEMGNPYTSPGHKQRSEVEKVFQILCYDMLLCIIDSTEFDAPFVDHSLPVSRSFWIQYVEDEIVSI